MILILAHLALMLLALTPMARGFPRFTPCVLNMRPASPFTALSAKPMKLSPEEMQANVPILLGLGQQHFMSQVLYSIVKLKIPDAIGEETLTAAEIKARLGNDNVREELLSRSLRFLAASTGLFTETAKNDDFAFGLTASGALLQTGVAGQPSLACSILHNLEPPMWKSWGAFSTYLEGKSTENPYVTANGMGIFKMFETNPESGEVFNEFMSIVSSQEIQIIVNDFEWSPFEGKTVVDVGGNYGPVMAAVKAKYPKIRTISFDLPEVINNIHEPPPGVELVSGDFFQEGSIPKTDGAIFMKHILHDWSDADCIRILGSCSAALEPGAKVIVVDAVLPNPGETSPVKEKQLYIDMLMSTFDGKERTREQWEALANAAGFVVEHVVMPSNPVPLCQILIFSKQ